MHAAVLDEHAIAGFPVDAPLVMDIVAAPLEDVENRAVHVATFLAVGSGRITFDVRFDRLRDGGGVRTDDMLAINLRASFPGHAARRRPATG